MSINWWDRIAIRQARQVIAFALLIGIVLSCFQIYLDYTKQKTLLGETVLQVLATSRKAAAEAAFNIDPQLAAEVAKGLFEYRPVISIRIENEFGATLADLSRPGGDRPFRWMVHSLFGEGSNYIMRLEHKSRPDYVVGTLYVQVDPHEIAAGFIERSLVTFGSGILRALLLALVLTTLFFRLWTRPLEEITGAFATADPRDPGAARIPVPQGHETDEFNVLVHSGNRLLESIDAHLAERARFERDLDESQRYNRMLFEMSPIGMVLFRADGTIVDANPAFAGIAGCEPHDALDRPFGALVPGLGEDWQGLSAGGRFGPVEHTLVDTRGGSVAVRLSGMKIDKGGGRFVLVTLEDVTEARRARERLRRAEQKYRDIVDNAVEGIFQSLPDGGFRSANPALARMLGYDSPAELLEEITDIGAQVFCDPEDRQRIVEQLRNTGEALGNEFRWRRRDGSTFWVSGNVRLVPDGDGGIAYFEGSVRDITDRRAAEEETRKFRTITDRAGYGSVIHDPGGVMVYVNRAFADMHGRSPGELTGSDFSICHSGIQMPRVRELRSMLGRKRKVSAEEVWHLRSDGTVFPTLTSATVIDDERGRPRFVASTVVDISGIKDTENQLHRTIEELTRSNTELERFAYVAAHDLQEPVRTVVSFAQLLERQCTDTLDDEAREYLDLIVGGAKRMNALVKGLLAYSRVGTKARGFREVPAADVVAAVAKNLNETISETGAQLEVGTLPSVVADRVQLGMVFQNLIGNAIKFRDTGVKPEVSVSSAEDGEHWVFSVTDNGIGIEPEYHERIFGAFKRLHTERAYPGTGIGLSICRRIVERHGGRIWVDSRPGHGSTFHFSLKKAGPPRGG